MFRLGEKIFIYILAVTIMMSSMNISVLAEDGVINYGTEAEVVNPGIEGWPNPPVVTAETAVVMEMTTAVCQYNKGRNEVRSSGFFNKFMVMLLTTELCELDEEVTYNKRTVDKVKRTGAIGIDAKDGEVMTVEDCLYALYLENANDAAIQLAKHVGGNTTSFVEMMNARAKELGCDETTFSNVTGYGKTSYTSAYDVALIVRAGLRNKTLRKILKKTSYTIEKTNKSKKRKLVCEEPLMNEDDPGYYEGCRAIAVFEDENGGYDMVAAAKQNEITYIVVTFGNENTEDSYVDSRALLDYAHNNFEKSDYMIGSIVYPKETSKDFINVKGTSDDIEVSQRYYVNNWLVGKGSQDINPPKETESILPDLIPTKTAEQSIDVEENTEVDDDDIIDMIEAEEELEYFKIYGLSLKQWNWIGTVVIAIGIVLYLLCALIKQKVKRDRIMKMRERERRKNRYIDE